MVAEPLIRVRGLVRVFGPTRVLDGVDLDVAAGEAVALLGPNGAGKTTLLKIVATLLRPTRGTATVAGHDCAREPEAVRPLIGVVAHGVQVYDDLTARENLRFWATLSGLPADRDTLTQALAEDQAGVANAQQVLHGGTVVEVDRALHRMPHMWSTELGSR